VVGDIGPDFMKKDYANKKDYNTPGPQAVRTAGDCCVCGHWEDALRDGVCRPCRQHMKVIRSEKPIKGDHQ